MSGRCITHKMEVMPSILMLAKEYLRKDPRATYDDAMSFGYMAFREELQRQTLVMKENLKNFGTL